MAKKPPSRGKLLKLKPKGKLLKLKPKGKVLQLKPKGKVLQLPKKKAVKRMASTRASATALALDPGEERLQEAMEELQEARVELSRLGHSMTAAHRELQEQKLSSSSSQSNLRAELDAVRTDLKTALAELEIARADRARIESKSQRRVHELEQALARLRVEVAELRRVPPPLGPPPSPPVAGGAKPEHGSEP